ncbi:putative Branched-chain amino acid ABC transporter permease protein [uncultured Desulfatiglans sp.]|uniref:Putative Branched-chain amino acid ABC transporter permease protein n=1 Tax=Uncultured Desulfatiglans sp. TaxID=1748965 RepID=A0A653A142_UNCDX|nr:putative Branched-chain amino acid ABC transporter permease protein [uncultured Desulfatiglans sp.]
MSYRKAEKDSGSDLALASRIIHPIRRSSTTLHFLLPLGLISFTLLIWAPGNGLSLFARISIYALAAQGLNFLIGLSAQVSFCQGALFGTGAVATMFFLEKLAIPFWLALPAGGTSAAALSFLLFGWPSARLKTFHIAAVTLLAQLLITHGLALLSKHGFLWNQTVLPLVPSSASFKPDAQSSLMIVAILTALLITLLLQNLLHTRYGRALRSLREDRRLAAAAGIQEWPLRCLGFSICAFCAGMAGGLFFLLYGLPTVHNFGVPLSLLLILLVLFGGMGRLIGPFFSASFLILFSEVLGSASRPLSAASGSLCPHFTFPVWETAAILFMIICSIRQPDGLGAVWERFVSALKAWPLPPKSDIKLRAERDFSSVNNLFKSLPKGENGSQ